LSRVPTQCAAAFTLVEMLVVVAIISAVMVLAVPALNSTLNSANLTTAAQLVSDQFLLARQEAVARNREVVVRFYRLPTATATEWRGVQVLRIEQTPTGLRTVPLSRLTVFPTGVIVSPSAALSPLLSADADNSGSDSLSAYGDVAYGGISYRPNGFVGGGVSSSNNFLTLQNANASGTPPPNYATIQINPVTGKPSSFRP